MPDRIFLTIGEVLQIHHQQITEYGGDFGIRDKALLESAVFRPQSGYYNSAAEEAAALLESLAINHPFIDGNKRIAFAAAHTFLLINGYDLTIQPTVAYDFIMRSLSTGEFRFAQILNWINQHITAAQQ